MARKHKPAFTYVIRSGDMFIGPVVNLRATLVASIEEAEVYDDRDNFAMKSRFFKAMFGMDFDQQVTPCAS